MNHIRFTLEKKNPDVHALPSAKMAFFFNKTGGAEPLRKALLE
jgi:hypothetical protein